MEKDNIVGLCIIAFAVFFGLFVVSLGVRNGTARAGAMQAGMTPQEYVNWMGQANDAKETGDVFLPPDPDLEYLQRERPFTKQSNGYSGWQMGCNYGQSSGENTYLDCANGIVYERIGHSPSVTYFNPNDDILNRQYCKNGEVATFSYQNPITKSGDGEFVKCFGW